MKQIIPRVDYTFMYGDDDQYYPIFGGEPSVPSSTVTFGANFAACVVPVAGTFRNLVLLCTSVHPAYTVTLYVNGVASILTATLGAADELAKNVADDVAVVAGDYVYYKVSGTLVAFPGFSAGTCIEFEGNESIYGLTPDSGGQTAGNSNFGGGLGNGQFMSFGGGDRSNTYSICACAGDITGLSVYRFATPPGGGTWTAYIRKNGILQDGSGGTVNTTVTLTDAGGAYQSSSFTLPVVVRDEIDIFYTRNVVSQAFANAKLSASLKFTPTTAGQFMLCGGNNDSVSASVANYKWTRSEQLALPEYTNAAPIGETTVTCKGLYVTRGASGAPGVGAGVIYTFRKNATDTAIQFTIEDLAIDGEEITDVSLIENDYVDIESNPFNTPVNNAFHWGLVMMAEAPPPPPDPNPLSGVFEIQPGKKHDFDESPILTRVRTALIGE